MADTIYPNNQGRLSHVCSHRGALCNRLLFSCFSLALMATPKIITNNKTGWAKGHSETNTWLNN